MHKPIFFIVESRSSDDVKDAAIEYRDEYMIGESNHPFDWSQGLIESGRWPDYAKYDKAVPLDEAGQLIDHFIDATQKDIKKWLETARKEEKQQGLSSDTMISYSIAASAARGFIFDLTSWSRGSVVYDQETIAKIKKCASSKLWIVGFDAHY